MNETVMLVNPATGSWKEAFNTFCYFFFVIMFCFVFMLPFYRFVGFGDFFLFVCFEQGNWTERFNY